MSTKSKAKAPNNYIVGIFVNNVTKEVSLTARKENCTNLQGMINHEGSNGFEFGKMFAHLSKEEAEVTKASVTDMYENAGYAIVKRPTR